jgi:predicted XRE-type DNA-binding protein
MTTTRTPPARRARKRSAKNTHTALAGSAHVTPAGGNVFADLGFAPDEAQNLKVRAQLMDEIRRLVERRDLTQVQAGALLGVSQPRVSDLLRGKIGLFTIDALVNMLAHAAVHVSISVSAT